MGAFFCLAMHKQTAAQVKKPAAKTTVPSVPDIEKMLKDLPADQRAMAKQMMSNISGSAGTKKEALVKPAPSPIVPILLKQPLQIPTESQAKDRLLWYKGKKMNDSIIVTAKGMVVLYSNKQNRVVAQPLQKTDPFSKIVQKIPDEAKMTDDYIEAEAAKKNSYMNYPLVQLTVDNFKMIDELVNDAIKNTVDLPELSFGKQVVQKSKGGDADGDNTPETYIIEMHSMLKQLLSNQPPLSFDAPPSQDNFSLAGQCDDNAQKQYATESKKWQEKFTEYEYNLFTKTISIERAMQLAGIDENRAEEISPGIKAEMQKSYTLFYARLDEKIKQLIKLYGKDIFRQFDVIRMALQYERQKQLLGQVDNGTNLAEEALRLMEGPEFENYINEQIEKKNWDVVLNLPVILGRERTLQLLGANNAATERLQQLLLKTDKLNRFALTVDIDFEVEYLDDGKPSVKASGEIKTAGKIYVRLARSACKWTLQQTGVDYGTKQEAQYIPLLVQAGIKKIKDDKDNWKEFAYSGPKDMLVFFPVFSIDFSEPGEEDSVAIEPARYLPSQSLDAGDVIENSYKTDLLGFLNSVFVNTSKIEDNAGKLMGVINEMQNNLSAITKGPEGNTTLDMLKYKYTAAQQTQGAMKKTGSAFLESSLAVVVNAKNGSAVLIDDSVDTKHMDGDIHVSKGIIKIKVVNEPVSE